MKGGDLNYRSSSFRLSGAILASERGGLILRESARKS